MTLHIRSSDLEQAEKFKVANPILFAVQNATRTLWRVLEEGVIVESIPPFRRCQLPAEAVQWQQDYAQTGQIKPLELELEVAETKPMAANGERAFPSPHFSSSESSSGQATAALLEAA